MSETNREIYISNGIIEALRRHTEEVKKAMHQTVEEMDKYIVDLFIFDWDMALDTLNWAEKRYARDHDEAILRARCKEVIDYLETCWEDSLTGYTKNDADLTVSRINSQIRRYIYRSACEFGYSGNYIDKALQMIIQKGEMERLRALVSRLKMIQA